MQRRRRRRRDRAGRPRQRRRPSRAGTTEATEGPTRPPRRRHRRPPRTTEATDTTEADGTTDGTAAGGEDAAARSAAAAAASRTVRTRTRRGAGRRGPRRLERPAAVVQQQHDPRGNAVANTNPLYLMDSCGGFSYYDDDLNLINNDQFGTCTIDSLDPLTITYRSTRASRGPTACRSTPPTCCSLGGTERRVQRRRHRRSTRRRSTAEADADGNPIVVGPTAAEHHVRRRRGVRRRLRPRRPAQLLEGYTYKEPTGVRSTRRASRCELVTQLPVISEDGLAMTIDVGLVLRRLPDQLPIADTVAGPRRRQ